MIATLNKKKCSQMSHEMDTVQTAAATIFSHENSFQEKVHELIELEFLIT